MYWMDALLNRKLQMSTNAGSQKKLPSDTDGQSNTMENFHWQLE
jgi:hypothetical protein